MAARCRRRRAAPYRSRVSPIADPPWRKLASTFRRNAPTVGECLRSRIRLGGNSHSEFRRNAATEGFTLIELVMVLMVAAILAAVAAPKYQYALASYRADAAAGRVAADLRMVAAYARKVSIAQSVQFNVGADSYSAPLFPDMNDGVAPYAVALGSSELEADVVSASFGGSATVQFDIHGRPTAAGTVVVASGSQQRFVQVDAAGYVSIL
jgi:prepilin-type N-terminal cleavage/methylation domain-containing protein